MYCDSGLRDLMTKLGLVPGIRITRINRSVVTPTSKGKRYEEYLYDKEFKIWYRGSIFNSALKCEVTSACPLLDCEQSISFFRFSKGSAHAQERLAAKPGDARNESVMAWSFACLGRFARRTKKKERLLVV